MGVKKEAEEYLNARRFSRPPCAVCATMTDAIRDAIQVYVDKKKEGARCSPRRYTLDFLRQRLGVTWGHNALVTHIRECMGESIDVRRG